jgi:uncharacterized membrane-anchored protein YhcB (DUF1043 family)
MNSYEYPFLIAKIDMLETINRQQADRIAELEKYKEQIETMEQAYDAHFAKALGIEAKVRGEK